jgi:hypothetical protein
MDKAGHCATRDHGWSNSSWRDVLRGRAALGPRIPARVAALLGIRLRRVIAMPTVPMPEVVVADVAALLLAIMLRVEI